MHAQERFFQMDLLRRVAGELAAWWAPRRCRSTRRGACIAFARAEGALLAPDARPSTARRLCRRRNAILAAALGAPARVPIAAPGTSGLAPADNPAVTPQHVHRPAADKGATSWPLGALHSLVPPDWYAFLTQHSSSDYKAALDDSRVDPVPVPASPWPAAPACRPGGLQDCRGTDARDIGSNNFAVSAAHATHRPRHGGRRHAPRPGVPGTWFEPGLQWKEQVPPAT